MLNVCQCGEDQVFLGNDGIIQVNAPINTKRGVVINNSSLAAFMVEVIAFVHHFCCLADHRITMCKPFRYQQL